MYIRALRYQGYHVKIAYANVLWGGNSLLKLRLIEKSREFTARSLELSFLQASPPSEPHTHSAQTAPCTR